MNDFAEEFLDVYAATNNKYSTLTAKKSAFKHHLLPAFGRYRLDEIGMRDLEAYKAKKLAAGLKPKSLNNHLIMLRKALSVAVDWELLSHVPKVRWLKGPQPEFDFLTFEEAERFLDAADPEWRPIFTLALRTGLRIGELRALRKGNWWRRRESKLPTLVASRVATRAKVTVRACDRSIRSLRQKPGRGSACLTCLHGCAKPSRESLQ